MAVPTRVIRRRIRAIASTGKIMKAMELVAGAKMRKTSRQTLDARPYAEAMERLWTEALAGFADRSHPLLAPRPGAPACALVLVAASDRGLCGGFNNRLLKKAFETADLRPDGRIEIVAIGRRAEQGIRRAGQTLVASFGAFSSSPAFAKAAPIARYACDAFMAGTYDRVYVAYTFFKSILVQEARLIPLLPLTAAAVPAEPSTALFEPTPRRVLEELVPRVIEQRLYQALLESAASEHAARMLAMKNAGEAAQDVRQGLVLALNRARQGAITQEISEISAGKATLESSSV